MDVAEGAALDEIEVLYRTQFAGFLRVATAIVGNPESGRDAVHDAFLAVVRNRRQYRGEGSVEAWIWRAVITSALRVRRASQKVLYERLRTAPDASWTDPRGEDLADLRTALARLPERQRLVLFLRYYADLDYRAIANVLHVRPGTIAAALNAAHRTLRRRIEEVSAHG